jgi:hypothetical protein
MLVYTNNLNKVEYKNLQNWIESFIDKYRYVIYEREMTLVKVDDDDTLKKQNYYNDRP